MTERPEIKFPMPWAQGRLCTDLLTPTASWFIIRLYFNGTGVGANVPVDPATHAVEPAALADALRQLADVVEADAVAQRNGVDRP